MDNKMDVLMLAIDDWANTGWRFFKSLQHMNLDVLALKGAYHPFMYPEQIPIYPILQKYYHHNQPFMSIPELKPIAECSKVFHFIASRVIDPGVDLTTRRVVVNHGGFAYRVNHEKINEVYNLFTDAVIIQCPDLLGLGAENEHLIYYPVDTDFIQPDFSKKDKNKLVIGHFPRASKVKGTEEILKVLEKYKKHYIINFSTDQYPWVENLKRMKQCDIIIETMEMKAQNRRYGEWGNTALEAAACGCIVISNTLTEELYTKEYNTELGIQVANNPDELNRRLEKLLDINNNNIQDIEELKQETCLWAQINHSIQSTARRLWDKIYSKFDL